jgi:DNA-binding response OmpR family regulator
MAHILLVEDDPEIGPLLQHILLAAGHTVDAAASCAGALALLHSGAVYDLVLADGRLADGSGFSIADEGRARGAKTLILTGYALQFSRDELERHPTIWKPVRRNELLAVVERRLNGIM